VTEEKTWKGWFTQCKVNQVFRSNKVTKVLRVSERPNTIITEMVPFKLVPIGLGCTEELES
jgi:hypothetical protein